MSIWKALYDIFDKERNLLNKGKANKQALTFEIKSNLLFLGDALNNKLEQKHIIEQLEHQVFDDALKDGFNGNNLTNRKITKSLITNFSEFQKYVGKDSQFMINNAYAKIKALKKIQRSAPEQNLQLKLKSLFRFLVLLNAHIEAKPLRSKNHQK